MTGQSPEVMPLIYRKNRVNFVVAFPSALINLTAKLDLIEQRVYQGLQTLINTLLMIGTGQPTSDLVHSNYSEPESCV